ncbi:MAG: hypothetical protein Q4F40_00550 [Akkermansia sp.]|nr:hypothetical protein [Akkermansia sp.]
MTSSLSQNIFRGVTILVASVLIALTVQFVLADPYESCSSESVAAWQEILPWFMVTAVLLWAGGFCLPRLQQWLALAALLVCTLPLAGLNGAICGHESYGDVPFYWWLVLMVGWLSYLLLFTGKAFYAVLSVALLLLALFLYAIA